LIFILDSDAERCSFVHEAVEIVLLFFGPLDVAVLFPGCVLFPAIGEDYQRIAFEEAIEPEAGAGSEFVELAGGVEEFESGFGPDLRGVTEECDLAHEDLVTLRIGASDFPQIVEAREFVMESQSHHLAEASTMHKVGGNFKRRFHF
jgi:hypothetical protein